MFQVGDLSIIAPPVLRNPCFVVERTRAQRAAEQGQAFEHQIAAIDMRVGTSQRRDKHLAALAPNATQAAHFSSLPAVTATKRPKAVASLRISSGKAE